MEACEGVSMVLIGDKPRLQSIIVLRNAGFRKLAKTLLSRGVYLVHVDISTAVRINLQHFVRILEGVSDEPIHAQFGMRMLSVASNAIGIGVRTLL